MTSRWYVDQLEDRRSGTSMKSRTRWPHRSQISARCGGPTARSTSVSQRLCGHWTSTPSLRPPVRPSSAVVPVAAAPAPAGCERRGGCTGSNCGPLIDAAVGEPTTLLPPSSEDIVASDIGEQLFLKLADVAGYDVLARRRQQR